MNKEKIQEILKEKDEILKQLDALNDISKEDIKNATTEEKLEFTKLSLEIKKKLAILEEVERVLSQEI